MNEKKNDLSKRLIAFAAKVIRLIYKFPKDVPAKRIADQLMRSSTSVGANYEEARGAQSKADFTHKLQISLKEMRESHYWLNLVGEVDLADKNELEGILDEAFQLVAILSKAVVTAKSRG